MPPAKETVRELLDRLPDDCSLEEVLYHLYVLQKIDPGLRDVAAGRVIPHDQVMQEFRNKWVTGRASAK
jgi:predicted transcriptional regulator